MADINEKLHAVGVQVIKTKKAADAIHGGLSNPQKMPGRAYGLPAAECKTGTKLAKVAGSTCSDCYACKGRYAFQNVQDAQYRRLSTIGKLEWVAAMVRSIESESFFRWHDSGDIQSVEHLRKIADVCEATPKTAHWLPTREKGILAEYRRKHGDLPRNLVVRLSAAMIDGAPPKVPGYRTSTVHKEKAPRGFVCGANTRGGYCGDCRACWDARVPNVSYPKH